MVDTINSPPVFLPCNSYKWYAYKYKKEGVMIIEKDRNYTDEEMGNFFHWSIHAVRSRRCKNKDLPKSFKIGRRNLTRGIAIIEFIQEREK